MGINWDALGGDDTEPARPPVGIHQAVLDRAGMKVSAKTGDDLLLTEWKTTGKPLYAWSTWFNFDKGIGFTRELLDAMGIDRRRLMDAKDLDVLDDEVNKRVGTIYTVEVKHWGDSGVNVEILPGEQQSFDDVPVDAPAPVTVPADDDSIPF